MTRQARYSRDREKEQSNKKEITVNGVVLQIVFCALIFLFIYTLKSSHNFL